MNSVIAVLKEIKQTLYATPKMHFTIIHSFTGSNHTFSLVRHLAMISRKVQKQLLRSLIFSLSWWRARRRGRCRCCQRSAAAA